MEYAKLKSSTRKLQIMQRAKESLFQFSQSKEEIRVIWNITICLQVKWGKVHVVDPGEITQNFTNIFENPVIATNVRVKINFKAGTESRDGPVNKLSESNTISRDKRGIGNVNDTARLHLSSE